MDCDLKVITKCKVYQACMLFVLLYGSECLTPLKKDLKKLDSIHNRCVRTILGITNKQQWSQRITSLEIRQRWGDPETATVKVMKRHLEWLGHVARMPYHRTPKICLFSWFLKLATRSLKIEKCANNVCHLKKCNAKLKHWQFCPKSI